MDDYGRLHALMSATEPMSESGEGGSHTDVLKFEPDKLRQAVTRCLGVEALAPAAERLASELSQRYLVKKGKIHYFSMPLLGSKQNHIRRGVVSDAFGPIGYNLMPTYDKTMLDAHEAMRVIPYFGSGERRQFFAPDFVAWLGVDGAEREIPDNADATFVRATMHCAPLRHTAYDLLRTDEYFHGRVDGPADLAEFQQFVRRAPLIPAMQEKLADFFEAPITVGWRDTLRWMRGSRHPNMPWEQARGIIEQCFERFGHENFLLPEITYYAYDTSYSPAQVDALIERNQPAARVLAREIESQLPSRARAEWQRSGGERLAFELLDYHHDYPLYDVEPYAGVLSGMMVRFAYRFARGVVLQNTGLPEVDKRNLDLGRIPAFHDGFVGFLARLDGSDRERTIEAIERLLLRVWRRGLRDRDGCALSFERIPRTFYTFQQLAHAPSPGGRVVALHELDELWLPENAGLWRRYPELAQKLVVFFTCVYRYFLETGFIPDLRPHDAGRDIFIYGIWGYVTENLLVVEEEDALGRAGVRVLFVDNRDQFKQYRRTEDRRKPLGPAKHALRLAYPLIEPAMQRSIGIFVQKVREAEQGPEQAAPIGLWTTAERGIDLARTFVNSKAFVDDLVDDLHIGAKRSLGDVAKKIDRIRPAWPPPRKPSS
jgi:hypothetical protein